MNESGGPNSLNMPNRKILGPARKSATKVRIKKKKDCLLFSETAAQCPTPFPFLSVRSIQWVHHGLDVLQIVVSFPNWVRDLLSSHRGQFRVPPTLLRNEQWVSFPAVVKRPEHETDPSPPSSYKAGNEWCYPPLSLPLSLICFQDVHGNNFTSISTFTPSFN